MLPYSSLFNALLSSIASYLHGKLSIEAGLVLPDSNLETIEVLASYWMKEVEKLLGCHRICGSILYSYQVSGIIAPGLMAQGHIKRKAKAIQKPGGWTE